MIGKPAPVAAQTNAQQSWLDGREAGFITGAGVTIDGAYFVWWPRSDYSPALIAWSSWKRVSSLPASEITKRTRPWVEVSA